MLQIVRISITGELFLVVLSDDPLFHLQKLVGGYIQLVSNLRERVLPEGVMVLVDEEGRLKKAARNHIASELIGQELVGPVVLVTKSNGDFQGLTKQQITEVQKMVSGLLGKN